jgi:solute carrier family 50 protein (sugar transporter)
MGLVDSFGTLGMLFAYALGVSPIPGLYQGYKDKDIKNITLNYFIFAVSNCSLWTLYGIKQNDGYLGMTNGILLILFLIYLGFFLFVKKEEIFKIGLYYAVIVITNVIVYILIPSKIIGFGAFIVNSAWALCAIETLKECLKKKDSKLINFQISLVSTLCSFSWLCYGILSENIFVVIPNLIGLILWSLNLVCYYWSNEKINDENLLIIYMKKIFLYNEPEYIYNKDVMHDIMNSSTDKRKLLDEFKTSGNSNPKSII